jgi:hypothetical protein
VPRGADRGIRFAFSVEGVDEPRKRSAEFLFVKAQVEEFDFELC